jgi:hypothetical protein
MKQAKRKGTAELVYLCQRYPECRGVRQTPSPAAPEPAGQLEPASPADLPAAPPLARLTDLSTWPRSWKYGAALGLVGLVGLVSVVSGLVVLAFVKMSSGHADSAAQVVGAPAPASPESEDRKAKVQEILREGNRALQAHDFTTVILEADKAIDLDPENADAHVMRGSAYFMIGNLTSPPNMAQCERGAADLRRALELGTDQKDSVESMLKSHEHMKILMGSHDAPDKQGRIAPPKAKIPDSNATGKQFTHEGLSKAVLGLSRNQVRAKLGPPDSISDNGNYWTYKDLVAGRGDAHIWFQQGVADLITY